MAAPAPGEGRRSSRAGKTHAGELLEVTAVVVVDSEQAAGVRPSAPETVSRAQNRTSNTACCEEGQQEGTPPAPAPLKSEGEGLKEVKTPL